MAYDRNTNPLLADGDVSVVLAPIDEGDNGVGFRVLEWAKYSAYGVPWALSMTDYNRDGSITGADATDYGTDNTNRNLRADVTYDGGVTIEDLLLWGGAARRRPLPAAR